MRNIESELHQTLLEIAPDAHDLDEQAMIIAEATAIYRRAETQALRTAGQSVSSDKLHEARMTDALLQAMGRLAQWPSDENERDARVDGYGLSAEQIVHQASRINAGYNRFASPGYGSGMDILNANDLAVFLDPETDGHEADDYEISDGEERHNAELYDVPGTPRHWSDSHTGR